jgi:hypothetical protein
VFLAGGAVGALAVVALALTWIGPALLLAHRAIEAGSDRASMAQALLAELAPTACIACPRLFVIAAMHPNGFALAGRERVSRSTGGRYRASNSNAVLSSKVRRRMRTNRRL